MNSRTIMLFNIWFVQLVLSGACKVEGSSLSHVRYDKSKSPSKILTNRNAVNEFKPNDTLSQKANVPLNLDASLYDRELDSENIPSSKGFGKSRSLPGILTNRNTVNEFKQNDTQSQKSNVSLNLNASSSDREWDSENIPPGGLYSQAKLDPYEGNALFSSKNKSGLYDPSILFSFPPEERPSPGVSRVLYKTSDKPIDSSFLAEKRKNWGVQ